MRRFIEKPTELTLLIPDDDVDERICVQLQTPAAQLFTAQSGQFGSEPQLPPPGVDVPRSVHALFTHSYHCPEGGLVGIGMGQPPPPLVPVRICVHVQAPDVQLFTAQPGQLGSEPQLPPVPPDVGVPLSSHAAFTHSYHCPDGGFMGMGAGQPPPLVPVSICVHVQAPDVQLFTAQPGQLGSEPQLPPVPLPVPPPSPTCASDNAPTAITADAHTTINPATTAGDILREACFTIGEIGMGITWTL